MSLQLKRAEIAAQELCMLLFVLDDMSRIEPWKRPLYALSLILSGWKQPLDHVWH